MLRVKKPRIEPPYVFAFHEQIIIHYKKQESRMANVAAVQRVCRRLNTVWGK